MKTTQLRRQNDLAGQLLNKLERIVGLLSKLPNEDDMVTRVNLAERLATALEQVKENLNADSRSADSSEPTGEAAAVIAPDLPEMTDAAVPVM